MFNVNLDFSGANVLRESDKTHTVAELTFNP